FANFCLMMI
nr:Chain C, peptide chain [Sprivivirus cyprinus]5Y91_C Chain C, PEPTIDE PHE-ALA-ASN-PHE-CYS-LEU-MET-MET-ILE [Sprivivirus cyprinus]6LBE_E Chain E, 9-mer peptide from RNA-DIRECTED RNA POLYMERASE L [synthetic construct]6LBE_F Chain F, 9-mer peptide from RNA-DIRECTED RNA POLYMERASE L [synthetic construct]